MEKPMFATIHGTYEQVLLILGELDNLSRVRTESIEFSYNFS